VLVAEDDAADGDPRDLRAAGPGEATGPESNRRHDNRHDRNKDGENPPEGELAPHPAAIDDMVGIERHGEPHDSRAIARRRIWGSMTRSNKTQLWRSAFALGATADKRGRSWPDVAHPYRHGRACPGHPRLQ